MFTLCFLIGLVVLGIYFEKKYSPRLKHELNGKWYFHYTAKKGVRNKKELF